MADLLADQVITFGSDIEGEHVEIATATPVSYHQAISDPSGLVRITIAGKLFVPRGEATAWPAVIIVPGSLGVAPSHLAHAERLTHAGIASCVIDPFGARKVASTVANQARYSFAASAWDVCAAATMLAARSDIDAERIGAQGHSRGGSAVMTAATTRFANATRAPILRAVYAAYPWCGHQFLDPAIGRTTVRAVIGDRDEWCLPQQVQGHVHAMRVAGGRASCRIFAGAGHSFDRGTGIELIEEAAVAPGAPTVYVADDGSLIHPLSDAPDPTLTERDLMIYGMKAGVGRKGAHIGSRPGDADAFREDMMAFWTQQLCMGAPSCRIEAR